LEIQKAKREEKKGKKKKEKNQEANSPLIILQEITGLAKEDDVMMMS